MSSGTQRSVTEYGLPFTFKYPIEKSFNFSLHLLTVCTLHTKTVRPEKSRILYVRSRGCGGEYGADELPETTVSQPQCQRDTLPIPIIYTSSFNLLPSEVEIKINFLPLLYFIYCRWLGSRLVSVLDLSAEGPGLKSQPRRCRVTVLGKLFTPIVPLFTKQRNWYWPMGREGDCGPGGKYWQPTAGFMTHVTCWLTAKNRDQLQNPTLGNRVWATFTFTF